MKKKRIDSHFTTQLEQWNAEKRASRVGTPLSASEPAASPHENVEHEPPAEEPLALPEKETPPALPVAATFPTKKEEGSTEKSASDVSNNTVDNSGPFTLITASFAMPFRKPKNGKEKNTVQPSEQEATHPVEQQPVLMSDSPVEPLEESTLPTTETENNSEGAAISSNSVEESPITPLHTARQELPQPLENEAETQQTSEVKTSKVASPKLSSTSSNGVHASTKTEESSAPTQENATEKNDSNSALVQNHEVSFPLSAQDAPPTILDIQKVLRSKQSSEEHTTEAMDAPSLYPELYPNKEQSPSFLISEEEEAKFLQVLQNQQANGATEGKEIDDSINDFAEQIRKELKKDGIS